VRTLGAGAQHVGRLLLKDHVEVKEDGKKREGPLHTTVAYTYSDTIIAVNGTPVEVECTVATPAVTAEHPSRRVWYIYMKGRKWSQPQSALTQLLAAAAGAVGGPAPSGSASIQDRGKTTGQSAADLPHTSPLVMPPAPDGLQHPDPSEKGAKLPTASASAGAAARVQSPPGHVGGCFGTFTAATHPTGKSRRPYRFCTRCWIKTSKWVMKHIVLPDGTVSHQGGHTSRGCPLWPENEPLTAEQSRTHAAAFKSAQRKGQLHRLAKQAFIAYIRDHPQGNAMSETDLEHYLQV